MEVREKGRKKDENKKFFGVCSIPQKVFAKRDLKNKGEKPSRHVDTTA